LPAVLIGSILANYALFVLEFVFDVSLGGSEPIFPKGVDQPAYALPTGYSAYFVLLLPLIAYRFFQARSVLRRLLWLALAAVSVWAIVYLGSRAAALIFLLTVVLLLAQYGELFRPRFLGLLAALAMLGVAAVIVLTPAAYWTRQKGVVEYETDPSISRRVSYLQAAWEPFRERPLLGAGPGTFSELYSQSLYGAKFGSAATNYRRDAHNTYVEVLIGSGLAGLACFLALVARALANFRGAVRRFKEAGDRADELLTRSYLIIFVTTLVFLLFISNLYMKYFWILLALSELAARFSREREREPGAGPAAADAAG
jgi:O-antigen ligase